VCFSGRAAGISRTRAQFLSSSGQRNDRILRGWLGEDAGLELIGKIGDKAAHYRELVRNHGLAPLPGAAEWEERLFQ
jgi:hypothetical protein